MDLVMQIINIVSLRPEMELCYVGMMNKCFEILESHPPRYKPEATATEEHSDSPIAPISAISTAAWMTQVASNLSMNNNSSPHPVIVEDEDSDGSDAEEADVDEDETEPLIMATVSSSSSAAPTYSLITPQPPSTTSVATTSIMPQPPSPPPIIVPGAESGISDQPATFTAGLTISAPTTMPPPPISTIHIIPPLMSSFPPGTFGAPPPPLPPPTTDLSFSVPPISMPIVDILDDSDDDPDAFADLESTADLDGIDDDPEDEDYGRAEWEASAGSRFSLREILFYDDKVEVFRARHGRL